MEKGRTLYVTDLDGTLLTEKKTLSEETAACLSSWLESGRLSLSIATARSALSIGEILKVLPLNLPLILMNGVFLYDWKEKRYFSAEYLGGARAEEILKILGNFGLSPFVYSLKEKEDLEIWYETLDNPWKAVFYDQRREKQGRRFRTSAGFQKLPAPFAVYMTLMDDRERLAPAYEAVKGLEGVSSVFYPDNYTQGWFLEIYSGRASKGSGVRKLKALCKAERVVVFGDNYNDMDMFQAADEGYAVENAVEELKAAATGVIGSNREDGVAKWLAAHL